MPFNPTLPAHNSEVTSAELREQFNGLKTLIDDLTVRVAALENPPATLTASGFGIPEVNGALVDQGMFGAEHYYKTAGDYYFIFSPGDNLWVVTNAPPGQSSPFFYTKAAGSITGSWNVAAGAAPAGTVT
jgi:hypothetical protein